MLMCWFRSYLIRKKFSTFACFVSDIYPLLAHVTHLQGLATLRWIDRRWYTPVWNVHIWWSKELSELLLFRQWRCLSLGSGVLHLCSRLRYLAKTGRSWCGICRSMRLLIVYRFGASIFCRLGRSALSLRAGPRSRI